MQGLLSGGKADTILKGLYFRFWHKADIPGAQHMSAFEPKRSTNRLRPTKRLGGASATFVAQEPFQSRQDRASAVLLDTVRRIQRSNDRNN
jgi:hypothetical protein